MKNSILSRLLALFALAASLVAAPAASAATLNTGDIVVVGHNSDTIPESFTFVNLVSIPAGTVVKFTDHNWTDPAGPPASAFGTVTTNEAKFTWTPATTVPAGTLFEITRPTVTSASLRNITTGVTLTANSTDTTGQFFYTGWTNTLSINVLNTSGDGVFFYQDADTNPFFISGFLNTGTDAPGTGFNPTTGWHDLSTGNSTTRSYLPGAGQGNQNGVNIGSPPYYTGQAGTWGLALYKFMHPTTYFPNVAYNGPVTPTNRDGWLSRIQTATNWSGTTGTTVPTGTFSTTTGSSLSIGAATTTVSSLNRVNSATTNLSTVNWTLTFAAANTGVTASNFSLSGTATSGATVGTPTTSNNITWNVPVTTGSTSGTLTLNLANATGTTPGVSTTLPFTGETYTMDKTAPTVGISPPSVSTIVAGAGSVTYTVTYTDTNFNASTLANGNITLNSTGGAGGTVNVTGSGSTRTVTISSITGVGTLGISIASGTATDTLGNSALAAGPSTTFAVTAPAVLPTVNNVSPTSGPTSGGQRLTITGTNFTGATGVTIGGTPATNFTVVNATTITCGTPAHSAGTNQSVVVTTGSGSNSANTLYTYYASTVADFETATTGLPTGTTFVNSDGTWSLTGFLKDGSSTGLGSSPVAAPTPPSNKYLDSGYGQSRTASAGGTTVGAINAPTGKTFKAVAVDIWPSKDGGNSIIPYTNLPNGVDGETGHNFLVKGFLNNVEVVSATVADTLRSPPQSGPIAGGHWNNLDLSNTTFATTSIDKLEFFLLTQSGNATDGPNIGTPLSTPNYIALDNLVYKDITAAATPTITVNPTSVALGSTAAGTASTPAQSFTVSGSNLTADIVITAPANVELSKDSGVSWLTSQTLTQSGGAVSTTTILARIPASAVATTTPVSVTGNITSASTGATTQNVSVTGTVNPIPVLTISPTSQTLAHNQQTLQVNFSSTVSGTTYTWSNNNTSIGIGASGMGGIISSFTATNTGSTPQTGTFTVTPLANGVQGGQKTFTITVNPPPTNVTINVPTGVGFTLNSVNYTGSQTVPLVQGSYTLSTTSPQSLGAGSQAVFSSWSDSGAISHSITVGASPLTITGSFTTQYQLTTAANPGAAGTVTPSSGTFYDSGTVVNVSATENSGFVFSGWSGLVANTSSAATTVTMDAAKSITANFAVAVPEIAVSYNSNNIADGSSVLNTTIGTDFGSTPVAGGVVENTYTITNSGTANLILGGGPNFVSVDNPAFSVTLQPSGTIAPSATTTFKIAFNPTALGSAPAVVSCLNNDSDEGAFDFAIIGIGTGPQTFDLVGHPVSNTPFDGGETYIYSAGPPPPQPINSAVGDVVSGGGAPNATGADSSADFDVLKRGGFLSENGTLTFPGNLLVGSGFPAVTLSNFRGLWKDNGTGLKLIARTGDIAPGTTTDTFSGLPDIPGISDNGDVTILGALTVAGGTTASNDTGLWTQVGSGTTPSTFNLLAREGSVVPGTSAVVRKFASGAYATASFSATQGVVAYSVTTVGSPDKTAIYSTTVDNGVPTSSTALAIEGNPAPGVAGQTFGPLASSYSDPARMDTAGNVAFAAILKPSNKESLWYAPYSTGVATKIFFAGDTAPDTGGATFLNLKSQAIGGTGTVTFRGLLTSNTGDNTGNLKNDGIWRGTGSNVASYTCILRRGDNNATRPGLNLPNAADKVGNLWHSWLTNANHGAWVGQLDAGGDGTSVPAPGDTYGIYTDLSGTMTLYMLYGDPAPGIPGAVMDTVDLPIVGGQEQLVFIGKVTGGGVTAGMNDQGIWRSAPNGGALSLLIRTGDSMTTTAGVKTIAKVDFPGSGSKARQWEQPVMDSTGRVLIFVTFIDGSTSQVIAP